MDAINLLRIELFPVTELPEFPCPVCRRGVLVSNVSNIKTFQSLKSKKYEEERRNGPLDDNYGDFVGKLWCNRVSCGYFVFVTGEYFLGENYLDKEDENGYPQSEIVNFLRPKHFQPSVELMYLHHQVPEKIQKAFAKCFEQFWLDNDACGNKLRIVVELLMDDQGIPSAKVLGPRIDTFKARRNDGLGDIIESVKWIGNGGSHGAASLQRADIIAAMEMLDFIARQLYDTETMQKAQQLREYSARVNAAKGPIERNPLIPPPPVI